jgi:cytoskeletal protein RodZ
MFHALFKILALTPVIYFQAKTAESSSDSDSSDSDSDSSDSDSDSDSDSSDSDSSDSDSSDSDSSDSDSSDEDEDEDDKQAVIAKKEAERIEKIKKSAEASAAWMASAPSSAQKSTPKTKGERSPGVAFTRVDADVWNKEIIEGLEDNSYIHAFGQDGYGAKASATLMQVQGKRFQHEKTKKKRGSYRGGEITLASNSFKYSD